jgi:hypothetical protein
VLLLTSDAALSPSLVRPCSPSKAKDLQSGELLAVKVYNLQVCWGCGLVLRALCALCVCALHACASHGSMHSAPQPHAPSNSPMRCA